jgi:arylsulfatase
MKQPNLLFIFTDEQACHTMKAYGNSKINTPNFNKFADSSIVFENAYVTQAVCTPSRSSIMTGLYPHTNGCTENNIPLKKETKCFPELADFSSYRKAYFGKWHLGDEISSQHGFDEWEGIEDAYSAFYSADKDKKERSSYHHWLVNKGIKPDIIHEDGSSTFSRDFTARLKEELTKPFFLAEKSTDFIKENKNSPFILYINFLEPHMPFFGPRDNEHKMDRVELPENYTHDLSEDAPLKCRLYKQAYFEDGHSGLNLKDEQDWKRMIANYWGLVSLVDTAFGKILDTLKESGLEDDTIIVFTSDHGDMMGSHKLLAKCVQYEEAIKVPLLIKLPHSGRNGSPVSNPVSQIDLVPTLLDYMNAPIPDDLQGYSWKGFIDNNEKLFQEDVFIEWNGPNNGFGDKLGSVVIPESIKHMAEENEITRAITDPVRTIITKDKIKLNWSTIGESELYDLNKDPNEINNLIGKAEYQKTIQQLKKRIKTWQKRTGDYENSNIKE